MKLLRHLLLACTAAVSLGAESIPEPTASEPAPPSPPEDPRDVARREAWTSAVLIVSLLEQHDQREFPGIARWLEDFRRLAAVTPAPEGGRPFPTLDVTTLVTRNPRFWAAFFEVQPGDPGLALLHAALLLSGGEAQRAATIAALGLQRTAPEDIRRGLHAIIAHCAAAQARSMELVRLGMRLSDKGEFALAVQQHDLALAQWPANGCAHYERGSALRMQTHAEARRTGTFNDEDPPADPPAALAAFARARQHDPLFLLGYQGEDDTTRTALVALLNSAIPAWENIRRKPELPLRTTAWRQFSEACRIAAIDDFALVLRQLVVSATRHYAPEDAEMIEVCLQRLAPAALTESLLARIRGEVRRPTRQIVVPLVADPPDSPDTTLEKPAKTPAAKKPATGAKKKPATTKPKPKRKRR